MAASVDERQGNPSEPAASRVRERALQLYDENADEFVMRS